MSRSDDNACVASRLVIQNLRGAIVGPVSLVVEAGTCAAIIGASGSGKSLLLRMIADLDPNDGEVRLGDLDRAAMPAPEWRRQVAYVAADAGWWAAKVEDHFPHDTWETAKHLALRLALEPHYFGRAVATLSTGEKQRLALVRALVRQPQVLLLDEPSSALDAASIGRVEALLRATMAGGTILVLVSHDPEQAERLGRARHVMQTGLLAPQ